MNVKALELATHWPVGHVAAGAAMATGPGQVETCAVGDSDHVFEWASITKMVVALGALIAIEEGTLALDEPAGPPGSTVAHLMAHASGLGPEGGTPLSPPGVRRIYSNAGFEVLGGLLARNAMMPLERYLHEALFEPLGMVTASLPIGASPAWGMRGTIGDLLKLGSELLSPTLIGRPTLDGATVVAFEGLSGVLPGIGYFDPCDWGLGFELRAVKSPHWTAPGNSPETFGHFGRSGGFLWVDPVAGGACGSLTDRPFGPWAMASWPPLSQAVLDEWRAGPDPSLIRA
ncbi:MAG: serine hydrolase domain-containing protein [Acidimicrobiales bacterium]